MDVDQTQHLACPRFLADRKILRLQAVAVVRLLLMPAVSLALVRGLAALRLLPADPICALTLLVQVRQVAWSATCIEKVRGTC